MILVFDTETTGLPDWKQPSDAPQQPHLVELSLGTFEDDGTEIEVRSMIIKPDGWVIPPEMSDIHLITHQHALAVGIPEADAAALYLAAVENASLRVAHNEPFDRRIMRFALLRSGIPREYIERIEARPSFDTCAKATKIVNLPPTAKMLAAGFLKPKPPKLEEFVKHFFGEQMQDAHSAEDDVRACARVYFHLVGSQPIENAIAMES